MEEERKTKMERYTIVIIRAGEEPIRLLIPFAPTAKLSELLNEIRRRASRLQLDLTDVTLHLESEIGPQLDEDDAIQDLILDPKVEFIVVVVRNATTKTAELQADQLPVSPSLNSHGIDEHTFKIRVVTPSLARQSPRQQIPLLRNSVSNSTTLRQLKALIVGHLTLDINDEVQSHKECNCSFARHITASAAINPSHVKDTCIQLIAVHGKGEIQIVEFDKSQGSVDELSILRRLREAFRITSGSKEICLIGGTRGPEGSYIEWPVAAICSKARHDDKPSRDTRGSQKSIDIHTSEAPIILSDINIDLTLGDLHFSGLAINGVVDLFVVERAGGNATSQKELGKDAIFLNSEAWEHPIRQTERGMAMLLSTLRVFSHLASARNLEVKTQDALLHLIYLLTNFPPAVRAIHTLFSGRSISGSDRAVLTQTLYEVLKDVVPTQLIKSDPRRYLEGTRLLFGIILEKSKQIKIRNEEEGEKLPYLSALTVIDSRAVNTLESVVNPVSTTIGLADAGFFEALKDGGVLTWRNGDQPLISQEFDYRTRRILLQSGALGGPITVFDWDKAGSGNGYDSIGAIFPAKELTDLNYLSALCSRNRLVVLPPANLPSADAPVLTLDREGSLAVYVGRAGCAEPGKDTTIFRPTSNGEENVDVAIITQLLVPILEERESDGTTIFDSYGDGTRKFKAPDEVLVVVVDCSQSMSEKSDFIELQGEDQGDSNDDSNSNTLVGNHEDDSPIINATFDEMKESLETHESFSDMVATLKSVAVNRRRDVAKKLLEIWNNMVTQDLSAINAQIAASQTRRSVYAYHNLVRNQQPNITKLKTLLAGLHTHRESLCDFLMYRGAHLVSADRNWKWREGDDIPQIPKNPQEHIPVAELAVPRHFLCPISQDIMEDPVKTCDGHTFDRNNIERWLQIRQSSPLTGLELASRELRVNGALSIQIKTWISGSEIISADNEEGRRVGRFRSTPSRRQSNLIKIEFFSRLGTFQRYSTPTLTTENLYQLAFRGLKGRNPRLQLRMNNEFILPSHNTIASVGVVNGSQIHISYPEDSIVPANPASSSSSNSQFQDMSLIKVYEDYDDVLFSYWVPKNTTNTFTSVIFRYWRHKFAENSFYQIREKVPWIGMTSEGDGHHRGSVKQSSDKLMPFLTHYHATGSLKSEKLCATPYASDDSDSDEDPNGLLGGFRSLRPRNGPLVLKVYLGGQPATKRKNDKHLSRMAVLQQMFDAFVNRLLAYNFQTHMGLVTFESTASVSQKITHAVENFRHKVNGMKAHGDTAVWDAISLASDQILAYTAKFPNAKRRILCISDGKDNKSKKKSHDLSLSLSRHGIVLDCFCLGEEDNIDLRTISYLSGGYKFSPDSMEEAMAICEMEPVLSSLERPEIKLPDASHAHPFDAYLRFAFARDQANFEVVSADVFPQRKVHPNLADSFVQILSLANTQPAASVNTHSDANVRSARILSEIRGILARPHPHYDVYVSEANMSFWKVVMQGPPQSAYSTGTFVLYIDMEEDYPAFPPKCRFVTPVYHPNINRHGKVCHSILDRNWTSDTTNLQLINTIYSLLLVPEFSDPINAVVTLDFHWDEVAFQDKAKAHIAKHATKTRDEWKSEILDE